MKKDVLVKAFGAKTSAQGSPHVPFATPEEGARLIRAFVAVRNPRIRKAIVNLVENLA